jgi:hypothetical protein
MRKQILSIATALTLLFTLSFVGLAAYGAKVTADIPFAFMVGGRQFPAGKYVITRDTAQNTMVIRSAENKAAGSFLVYGGRSSKDDSPRLVFNKYGERRFLNQVWDGTSDTAHQLQISGAERRARQQTPDYLAQAEIVTVTARAE